MAEICDSLSKGKSKEYVRKGVIYFMNCPFNKNNKKRKCQDRPTIHHDYGKNHKSHYNDSNDNNCNRGSSNSSLLIEVIIIVASEAVVEVVVIVFPSAALVLVVVLVEVVIVILVASVNNSNISSRVWKVAVVEIVEEVVLEKKPTVKLLKYY